MRKIVLRTAWAALALVGMALAVGAQGPPPEGLGGPGFGPGGMMAGSFEFDGLVGALSGKIVTGKPFQATFTITHSQTLPGNSISNTVTGTIARDTDGSRYRDVKLPAIGPWAASGQPPEMIFIRNQTKMMEYFINVNQKTYRANAIAAKDSRVPGANSPGRKSTGAVAATESATDTQSTYTDPVTQASYNVDDHKVVRTIPAGQIGNQFDIVITTERMYSPDLDVVLQMTRSDPRFGNFSYQLSNIGQPSASLFVPDPSFALVQGHGKFGLGDHGGPGKMPPPPPQD